MRKFERREETDSNGITRVNGRGMKTFENQLREEMEKELNAQLQSGKQILDHGLGEHSPGYVDWYVVAAGKKVDEKPGVAVAGNKQALNRK